MDSCQSLKVHSRDVASALHAIKGNLPGGGVGFTAGFVASVALRNDGEDAPAVGFKLTVAVPFRAAMESARVVDGLESGDFIAAAR